MITAKEARERTDSHARSRDKYIDSNFARQIADAADNGKNEYIHHIGDIEYGRSIKASTMERNVIDLLRLLGYDVRLTYYGEPYVPRGLEDDVREYINCGILVRW